MPASRYFPWLLEGSRGRFRTKVSDSGQLKTDWRPVAAFIFAA
jgi:hypothetical protein